MRALRLGSPPSNTSLMPHEAIGWSTCQETQFLTFTLFQRFGLARLAP